MDEASIMPEQVALFERHVSDHVWAGRLTTEDEVVDLGSTFVINGLVTPCRVAVSALIAPESIAGAAERISAVTLKPTDGLISTSHSGNPDAPSYWEVSRLGDVIGLDLSCLPQPYEAWRLSTEIYILRDGAAYMLLGDYAIRHRVLGDDEVSLTFVQRLLPFMRSTPDQVTGTMILLAAVPSRLAALGGLRGYRRALIESGIACAAVSASVVESPGIEWIWDTEFYDDAASSIIGVDGVERIVTYIGYQHLVDVDADEFTYTSEDGEVQ